jgi:hypothetical protein
MLGIEAETQIEQVDGDFKIQNPKSKMVRSEFLEFLLHAQPSLATLRITLMRVIFSLKLWKTALILWKMRGTCGKPLRM